jgi:hypothetical protein
MAEEEIDPIVNLPTPEVVDTYFAVTDENGILLNKVRPENIEGQIPTDKLNIDLSTLNSYNNLQGIPYINNHKLESGDNSLAYLGIQEYLGDSLLGNFINKTDKVNANAFVITDKDGNLISAGSANETFINRISTLKDIDSNKAAVLGICKDGFVLTDIQITKKDNGVGETGVSSAVLTSITTSVAEAKKSLEKTINDVQTGLEGQITAKIESLGAVLNFKGTKGTDKDLPSSGNTAGDVWNVTDTDMNYVYTGEQWDPLGSAYYDSDKRLYSQEGVNLDNKIFIEPVAYPIVEYIGEGDAREKITATYSLLKVRFTKTVSAPTPARAPAPQSEPQTTEEASI